VTQSRKITAEKAYVMQGCAFSVSVPQQPEVSAVLQGFNPDLLTCNIDTFETLKAPGRHQHINASLAYAAINMLNEAQFMTVDPKKAKKRNHLLPDTGTVTENKHRQGKYLAGCSS